MASTSDSSVQKRFKYDVFLSFRGEDTRNNFVDHLYHALHQKGIITYKDDEQIEKGERIGDELIRSIEESRYYIIVFSKNYASSSWCLDQLVKIMECHKTKEQTAYPIFYDVEPTEVRNQSGVVGEAFAKHEKGSWGSVLSLGLLCAMVASCCNGFTWLVDLEKDAGRWRDALKEAAGLAGWELKTTVDGSKGNLVTEIVEGISQNLHFINSSFNEKLVGMETRVKDVLSSLEIDNDDVRMIGIKGMGGSGKTALARAVFDHISIWFEGKSFVENVREVSRRSGLKELKKKVLLDVLNDQHIVEKCVSDQENHLMQRMMCGRKVLVVLDDVDHIGQLDALAGETTWFKPGSRIIITTRDEQVLVAHGVHSKSIHDVNLLSNDEAICLFSRYAFGREIPIQGYEELSEKAVHYAAGLPLTIKVLGSHLCGRCGREWVDALERLKTIPLKETVENFELSFNGLEYDHKEIFLDVACLLKGMKRKKAIKILESLWLNAKSGLKVLEQKSLITISDTDILQLHDHIAEMGRYIVRRLHPEEPNKHSRLWIKEEIEDILANNLGTKATRSIKLLNTTYHPYDIMNGLRNMQELRFLYVHNSYSEWHTAKVGQYLPDSLRSLYWPRYPCCYLPNTFRANKLVNLEMRFSNISQFWEEGKRKVLNMLKFVDLKYSKLVTFDLRTTPNLERLNLGGCNEFVELHMPVGCPNLKSLDLKCSKLITFDLGTTPNLERLNLGGCNEFVELHMPVGCPNLKFLKLIGSKVSNLNLGLTPYLIRLDLEGCKDFVELQMPVECPKLEFLNLSYSKVSYLNLGLTPHLSRLDLKGCKDFVELLMPVECSNLKFLNLSGSKVSNLNLGLTPYLSWLDLEGCKNFVELHMPVDCPNLEFLNLSCSKVSNLNLGLTPNLSWLDLEGCKDFVELHMPVECSNLEFLNLSGSKVSNLNLGLTPYLSWLDLGGCEDFVELHIPIERPNLKVLNLSGSNAGNLNLCMTPNLERLNLAECENFLEFQMPPEFPKLEYLNLSGFKVKNLDLGMAPHLRMLDLKGCKDFEKLHMPIKCSNLNFLNLSGSKVRNLNLQFTPNLSMLDLEGCKDFVELHMPVKCPNLNLLNLSGSKVNNLNLWYTPNLSRLDLEGCKDLVELYMPVGCPNLKFLNLSGSKVSNLNLGLIPNLIWLDLEGCNDFVELHMPDECLNLEFLNLSGSKMSNFNLGLTPNLIRLDLKGCKDFVELHMPVECANLKFLNLCGTKVNNLNLGLTPHLERLNFEECYCLQVLYAPARCLNLESISAGICGLHCLKNLTLEGSIPKALKDLYPLESLEELTLWVKEIKHLPDGICMLKRLKSLDLKSCWLLEQLPNDLGRLESLEKLDLTDCISLRNIPNIICNMKCLTSLLLPHCILVKKLPDELGRLNCLKELNIEGTGITHLPQSIFHLKGLCIIWSKGRLELHGFRHLKEISRYTASCYI